jgi:hypothetical protein
MTRLAKVDKHVLSLINPSTVEQVVFLSNISKALSDTPFGGVYFQEISVQSRKYKYTFQVGSDTRLDNAAQFPSPGLRLLLIQAQLAQAFLRTSSAVYSNATISQSLRAFPILKTNAVSVSYGSYLGRILFPFGVSFLLPVFVLNLVQEKEAKVYI